MKNLSPTQQNATGLTPPVGWYSPSNITIASAATGALVTGRIHFQTFFVGPQAWTADTISFKVATAQSGGTTTMVFGIYADDGTGLPDGTKRLATATATALTTASTQTLTLSSTVTFAPGLYWIADLYVATVAPTTIATITSLANVSSGYAASNLSSAFGNNLRGYWWASQTVLPTTAISVANLNSAVGSTDIPLVYLHRSA